ncbi:hypothetical protein [Hansschlegelia sp. KR7-227]|uniref:hypothetical protein n=1 Tax=Hansschlegelia sp. KR7-227 TaxID=3400914 RepID=UPI003C11C1B5
MVTADHTGEAVLSIGGNGAGANNLKGHLGGLLIGAGKFLGGDFEAYRAKVLALVRPRYGLA